MSTDVYTCAMAQEAFVDLHPRTARTLTLAFGEPSQYPVGTHQLQTKPPLGSIKELDETQREVVKRLLIMSTKREKWSGIKRSAFLFAVRSEFILRMSGNGTSLTFMPSIIDDVTNIEEAMVKIRQALDALSYSTYDYLLWTRMCDDNYDDVVISPTVALMKRLKPHRVRPSA